MSGKHGNSASTSAPQPCEVPRVLILSPLTFLYTIYSLIYLLESVKNTLIFTTENVKKKKKVCKVHYSSRTWNWTELKHLQKMLLSIVTKNFYILRKNNNCCLLLWVFSLVSVSAEIPKGHQGLDGFKHCSEVKCHFFRYSINLDQHYFLVIFLKNHKIMRRRHIRLPCREATSSNRGRPDQNLVLLIYLLLTSMLLNLRLNYRCLKKKKLSEFGKELIFCLLNVKIWCLVNCQF